MGGGSVIDPRLVAVGVLGPVDWQSEVSGFCRCPGEHLHTHPNGKKDCLDTAGKSLHAWFDAPRNKVLENRLKAGLTVFGCDPKLFTCSQPVRVPGAYRDGKLQRLVWLSD